MDAPPDGSRDREPFPGDALAALRLLVEWGADDALADLPQDRRQEGRQDGRHDRLQDGRQAATTVAAVASPAVAASPARPVRPPPPAPAVAGPGQASTLAELREALLAFEGCALRFTAKSLALSDGNPEAGLVVVGEVPSDDDDREGRPFAGASGAQLDRVFGSVGLDRQSMLLTLLVPWRTPGKRPPSASEVAACLPFLQRHLQLLRPRRLVLLGSTVTRALGLGAEPIGRLRGSWRSVLVPGLGPVPALATRSLDTSLKTPNGKRDLWHDLVMLKAALSEDTQG